jgi:hypothetical protein
MTEQNTFAISELQVSEELTMNSPLNSLKNPQNKILPKLNIASSLLSGRQKC